MKITVNGEQTEIAAGATLKELVEIATFNPDTQVAIVRSSKELRSETDEYEVTTDKGAFVIHVEKGANGDMFRIIRDDIADRTVRWKTSKVLAMGSFPTDLSMDNSVQMHSKFDCFFALGGFDNQTTYFMIAMSEHDGSYGVLGEKIGRVTRGRHTLEGMDEGDRILSIEPVVLEYSEKDAFIVEDLGFSLEEGMLIETVVDIELNSSSPLSAEHLLVMVRDGTFNVDEKTSTYAASTRRMEENMVAEDVKVRDAFDVTVRHQKEMTGKIYFYLKRRQVSEDHTLAGRVTNGRELMRLAQAGGRITVRTNPSRVMSVGMTQQEAVSFLDEFGVAQIRSGNTDDNATIVKQEPELTIDAILDGKVTTEGIETSRIFQISLTDEMSPKSAEFFRKVTGLDHLPIGRMKVHFTYPGFSMVTFEGSRDLGKRLGPEEPFGPICKRNEIGVTSMVRPNAGIIGVRVTDSDEFGPTGEERYCTNMVGRFLGDLDIMLEGLKEGDVVYIREVEGES